MKFIFMALLAFIEVTAFAQQENRLFGKAIDSNKHPLAFCPVSLLRKDSALVKGTITDSLGNYEFRNAGKGEYYVMINTFGYTKYQSGTFSVDTNGYMIPDIQLSTNAENLTQVTITSRKKLFEMYPDKMVMNIDNSILAVGNSAFEALRRAPGVTTDKDDNILLKGAKCQIFIDGKISYLAGDQLTEYLKSLPADAISKIEIITNPSSKYDAAGASGIINIVLKKNKANGLNGTVNAGAGYGRYQKEDAGINLNYRQGKANIFGSGYAGYSESYNELIYNTVINNSGNIQYQDRNQYWHPLSIWYTYKTGIDYNIGKKSTIGILITGATDNTTAQTNDNTIASDASHNPYQYINVLKHDTTNTTNVTYNINYKTEIDTAGSELTFDADYVNYVRASANINTADFLDAANNVYRNPYIFTNDQPANINVRSAKTDLTYYFKNKVKIETGLKYSNVVTDNNLISDSIVQSQWVQDNNRSNHFIYKEAIAAGYATLSKDFKKTSVQAGLRAEQTESTGTSVTLNTIQKRNYLDLFPTLFVTQTLNDDQQLNFGYSRRIARPSYQSLNPFTSYIDPYTLFAGNPYLRPAYSNIIEIKHSYKQILFISLSYTHTTHDQIDGVLQGQATGITTNIPENQNSSDYLQLSITASLDITKIWNSDMNMNVNYGKDYSSLPNFSYDTYSFGSDFNSNNTFQLPKGYKLQTSIFYSTPTTSGITKIKSAYGWDLGIQKQLLDKKATLKLNAANIIGTSAYRAHIIGDNLDINWSNKWEGRKVSLSFVWKFGNAKVKNHSQHTTSSQEEKSRIK